MEFSGQYLTYYDYKALGGNLDQTPFDLLEFEARKKIDERTQRRLVGVEFIPQEVKICVFKLIDTLQSYISEKNNNKNIASESVGSYSVSYVSPSEVREVIKSKNAELDDIIMTDLYGVIVNNEHIIYAGVN